MFASIVPSNTVAIPSLLIPYDVYVVAVPVWFDCNVPFFTVNVAFFKLFITHEENSSFDIIVPPFIVAFPSLYNPYALFVFAPLWFDVISVSCIVTFPFSVLYTANAL